MAAYAARAYASATAAAYRRDWGQFTVWCHSTGQRPLPAPARTLARYATVLADTGLKVATIERACAAVALAHRLADHDGPTLHPDVQQTLAGIRRELGTAAEQKRALVREDLARLVAGCDEDLRGRRDRALLLVGWAGGLRRGELAALIIDDLVDDPDGLVVRLARSKGDQEAKGRLVGVRYAPMRPQRQCLTGSARRSMHSGQAWAISGPTSLLHRPKVQPPTPSNSRWTTRNWIALRPRPTPSSAWNASPAASCRHPHLSAEQPPASLRSPRGQWLPRPAP